MTAKLWLIHRLDWIDVHVFDHRWQWFCNYVGFSDWWGEDDCLCAKCRKARDDYDEIVNANIER